MTEFYLFVRSPQHTTSNTTTATRNGSTGNGYKEDSTAFIFTLTNPHSIPPTKYSIDPQKKQFAIACKEGIAFGNGSDIYIANNSNYSRSSSYTNFPYTYVDSTGKRNNTFTGQFNFTAQEIEVYSVVDI